MNADELIALDELTKKMRAIQLTADHIAAMEMRIADAEDRFAVEAEAKRITSEWLNFQYTI